MQGILDTDFGLRWTLRTAFAHLPDMLFEMSLRRLERTTDRYIDFLGGIIVLGMWATTTSSPAASN